MLDSNPPNLFMVSITCDILIHRQELIPNKALNNRLTFTQRYPEKQNVIEIVDVVEEGVTYPIRCRMDSGISAVVKYPNNPIGLSVLIDEWIGNSIADAIGISIPRYGLCNLSEQVIYEANLFEEIGTDNAGTAFFSEYIGNTTPANSVLLSHTINKEAEALILFDHIIKNEDRHIGNLLVQTSSSILTYFIDCSHFLTRNGRLERIDLN